MHADMELGDIFAALRRRKRTVVIALLLAIAVAAFSLYKPDGSPRAVPAFNSQTRVLVDSSNFGLGRVELSSSDTSLAGGGFGDRAQTVVFFVDSKLVTDRIPQELVKATSAIVVTPLLKTPVIQIEVTADTPQHAQQMATALPKAMQGYFASRQAKASTPQLQRVEITLVQPATDPVAAPSQAKALAILAFLMVFGAGLLVAIVRDNYLRTRAKRTDTGADDDRADDASRKARKAAKKAARKAEAEIEDGTPPEPAPAS